MDPYAERHTKAIEEIADNQHKIACAMARALELLAHPPKQVTGEMSAVTQTDAVRWLRESEALLTGVEERRGIGRVSEVHSVPWRVARLIRRYEREHQQLNDILDALADANDLDRVKAEIADLLKDGDGG